MVLSKGDLSLLRDIKRENIKMLKKKRTAKQQSKSNKRAISTLNRRIENKVVQSVAATVPNRYGGQYIPPTQVDINGLDATGAQLIIRPFSGMGVGTLQSQRTGSAVTMTSLTYKIKFEAGLDSYNTMGCLIVLDRNPTGTAPSLDTGAAAGVILNGTSSFQYLRYQNMDTCAGADSRFKVLKHIRVNTQTTAAGNAFPPLVIRKGTINSKYNVRYNAVAGSVEPVNQQILFCFYSDSGLAPHPSVSLYTRFRYKDS